MHTKVGTWSSIIVLTSFIFGIVVFQEKVKNFYYTCDSFVVLIIGLIGMAKYAAPPDEADASTAPTKKAGSPRPPKNNTSMNDSKQLNGDDSFKMTSPLTNTKQKVTRDASQADIANLQPMEIEPLLVDGSGEFTDVDLEIDDKQLASKDRIIFCGGRMALTRHQTGVIGAIINGAWGGLNLIPLHYARRDHGLSGAGFLVSFATGSLIVNTILWLALIGYHMYHKKGNWEEVKTVLPKWHIKHLWKMGLAAGLLYSLGNFSALLAVTYLGQGVGFSFCQLQLLVSGLWGICYFKGRLIWSPMTWIRRTG